MQHFRSLDQVNLQNAWATIGMFDGVHRGHQAILTALVQAAHAAGEPAIVVTFSPHPAVVLRGVPDSICLTTPEERAALIGDLGVDAVLTLTFDRELASRTAEEFLQPLCQQIHLHQLWVGEDFALGRNRQGDLPALRQIGEALGYQLHVISEITQSGARISSSQIRQFIQSGKVAEANQQLGRAYSLSGTVVHGDGRGHGLGIPTANLGVDACKLLPANGVYATWAVLDDQRFESATNIGVRPVFNGTERRVEALLLDHMGNLYDQPLRLEFVEYLRPETDFPSVDALLAQIQRDTQQAKLILSPS